MALINFIHLPKVPIFKKESCENLQELITGIMKKLNKIFLYSLPSFLPVSFFISSVECLSCCISVYVVCAFFTFPGSIHALSSCFLLMINARLSHRALEVGVEDFTFFSAPKMTAGVAAANTGMRIMFKFTRYKFTLKVIPIRSSSIQHAVSTVTGDK